ncbi:MAG: FMN-binding negative transcriptional regulator, partial [Alphaproteobacteria bacterium]|nr:FMN-binding negative transcriptional regulator [Alphaproteobacteria bacterium]
DEDAGPLGGVRFHLARNNPLASSTDAALFFSFRGPDAYISPDWYASKVMVPTWNYVAIEAHGIAKRMDKPALRDLLVDLSAQEEARLLPKPPWTISKVPEDLLDKLFGAIVGVSVRFESILGKFKLSKDKSEADYQGIAAGLAARGDASALSVASWMKKARGA